MAFKHILAGNIDNVESSQRSQGGVVEGLFYFYSFGFELFDINCTFMSHLNYKSLKECIQIFNQNDEKKHSLRHVNVLTIPEDDIFVTMLSSQQHLFTLTFIIMSNITIRIIVFNMFCHGGASSCCD